jgi:hypothetical protein
VQAGQAIQLPDGDIGSLPLHDIVVPLDELNFWVDVTLSGNLPGGWHPPFAACHCAWILGH